MHWILLRLSLCMTPKRLLVTIFLFLEQAVHTMTKSPLKFPSEKLYLFRSPSLSLQGILPILVSILIHSCSFSLKTFKFFLKWENQSKVNKIQGDQSSLLCTLVLQITLTLSTSGVSAFPLVQYKEGNETHGGLISHTLSWLQACRSTWHFYQ